MIYFINAVSLVEDDCLGKYPLFRHNILLHKANSTSSCFRCCALLSLSATFRWTLYYTFAVSFHFARFQICFTNTDLLPRIEGAPFVEILDIFVKPKSTMEHFSRRALRMSLPLVTLIKELMLISSSLT